jgi:phosphoglycolate phosphatase-like HAD superfamily hydrolase
MRNYSPENQPSPEMREISLSTVKSDFENEKGENPEITIDTNAPALFLFDIDGTLIDANKIHGEAVVKLYGKKFSLPGLKDPGYTEEFKEAWYSNFGLGDRKEHELLLENLGISFSNGQEKEATLDELMEGYGQSFEEILINSTADEKQKFILPGVRDFLEAMKEHNIPSAIVTGNVKKTTQAIMKYLGFSEYFITGGFDDDQSVTNSPFRRATILKSVLEKLKAKGINKPIEQTMVFGDTPKDFEATLHSGTEERQKTFLVATGTKRFHDLSLVKDGEKRPHLITPKLSDIKIPEFFKSLYLSNNHEK